MKSIKVPQKKSIKSYVAKAASHTAFGRVLSSKFFKKHLFSISFAVGLTLIYISNRYDCVTGMETINALQSELDIVRTELQNQRSTYMSATREKSMQSMIDTLHLGLAVQDRPPYQLKSINHGSHNSK